MLLLLSAAAFATDLSRIERKIAKAPKFKTPVQYYALLALGPDAKTRIWFVIDGRTLYVDHNGNGDLTEAGERLTARKTQRSVSLIQEMRSWKLKRLAKSGRYTDIQVSLGLINPHWNPSPTASNRKYMERFMRLARKTPHANLSGIKIRIDRKRTQSCTPRFSTKPESAPILHMDAPLTIGILENSLMPFRFGTGEDLKVAVGTPGLGGPGTFSYITYAEIPNDARPHAVVALPDGRSSQIELFEKC